MRFAFLAITIVTGCVPDDEFPREPTASNAEGTAAMQTFLDDHPGGPDLGFEDASVNPWQNDAFSCQGPASTTTTLHAVSDDLVLDIQVPCSPGATGTQALGGALTSDVGASAVVATNWEFWFTPRTTTLAPGQLVLTLPPTGDIDLAVTIPVADLHGNAVDVGCPDDAADYCPVLPVIGPVHVHLVFPRADIASRVRDLR